MRTRLEVEEGDDYGPVIDEAYERAKKLKENMDVLARQSAGLLNYQFDPEELEKAARYVKRNIPDGYAVQSLKEDILEEGGNPEEIENWELLEEAVGMVEPLVDRYRSIVYNVWKGFGCETREEVDERTEDLPPVTSLFETWENTPWALFEDEDPTYFDVDLQSRGLSREQRKDVREKDELKDVGGSKDPFSDLDDQETRIVLGDVDRKWVNERKLAANKLAQIMED